MRVIHVSPTDTDGGAAKGTYKLHGALREAGVDSLMLVQRKYSDDHTVLPINDAHGVIYDGLRDRLDRLPLKLLGRRPESWWTVGWLPFEVRPLIDRLAPDIVQFHWAGRGAAPIATFQQLRHYPIVWTLRDMWPLTGGCHYSDDCEKFLAECRRCPKLGASFPFDLARRQWRRKYRTRRGVPITYIALSTWMADYARRSPLTFDNEVSIIPNGVDTERFAPVSKTVARSIWRLPDDRQIIMFGAINGLTDQRKGFSYLQEALERLAARGWRERAMLVAFGSGSRELEVGLSGRCVGWVNDDVSLALLYACADVMVVPSIQENLGKTAIEAMACGVPVAAFANTGMTDIVDHKVNGYLAEDLSAEDLADGIAWCLERAAEGDSLSLKAREKVMRCFDIREIASRHIELYQNLIRRCAPVADDKPSAVKESNPNRVLQEGLASGPVVTP